MSHTRTQKRRRRAKTRPKRKSDAHKPRYAIAADGRIGRPDVFEYETEDGRRHAVQPREPRGDPRRPYDCVPYKVIVHDQKAYERLRDTGWIRSEEHSGPRQPTIDNRSTKV